MTVMAINMVTYALQKSLNVFVTLSGGLGFAIELAGGMSSVSSARGWIGGR